MPRAFVGERAPDPALFGVAPESDPLTDGAELGPPPALAEFKEYIDETDNRFDSMSVSEGRCRMAASGNGEPLHSSAIVPADNRGVSKSSTAKSSLLPLLLGLPSSVVLEDL